MARGADVEIGVPLRFIASCEADVTGDGRIDLVVLVQTRKSIELLALVTDASGGYKAFVLAHPMAPGNLRCEAGAEVKETAARPGRGRVFKTPGAFVHLIWPEESSVAYIWTNDKFVEVWTSD